MSAVDDISSGRIGARFLRCDLHVHSPGSRDIHASWAEATPTDLVDLALAADLDVIAITDHNSAEWCDSIREAAQDTPLTVLPGTEISTPEGHLLAIFGPDTDVTTIRELLIEVGINEADFGRLDIASEAHIEDVAARVVERGGIAIAAHVDGPMGFSRAVPVGARRQVIEECFQISAYETHNAELAEGLMKGIAPGFNRRVAAVDASDSWDPAAGEAHRLDAIGLRHCHLKVDDISVRALRQALGDPDVRLLRDGREPIFPPMVIEGIVAHDGFVRDQVFRFSPNINCLIGGTGSGKSLTLELIRFALSQQANPSVLPAIRREVDSLLGHALSDSTKVSVLLRKGETRYLVERVWLNAGSSPAAVHVLRDDGDLETLTPTPDLQTFFPIKAFSQSEIIEYSRESLARLALVDDLLDMTGPLAEIAHIKNLLRENADAIIASSQRMASAREQLKLLPGIREEVRSLDRFFLDPAVADRKAWEDERSLFAYGQTLLAGLIEQAERGQPPAFDLEDHYPETEVNADLVQRVRDLAAEIEELERRAHEELVARLKAQMGVLDTIVGEWQPRFDAADRQFREKLIELDRDGQGRSSLADRLAQLRATARDLSLLERQLDEELVPVHNRLEEERNGLLTELQAQRKAITTSRQTKARDLTERLEERVRITVRRDRDGRKFLEALGGVRGGSHVLENQLEAIADSLHPIPLVKSLLSGDWQTPAAESGLDYRVFERFAENIHAKGFVRELYEVQLSDLEDVVEVQFAVEDDRYRDLESLAHGQKCTVVLMIALAEGASPLIVDQPEDALHAPWIEQYIVARLRGDKGIRQSIFATRSANVLVSSDSEQIIAMEADAEHGWIRDSGNIDRYDTRTLVLFHVEGGEEAFERRRKKYLD